MKRFFTLVLAAMTALSLAACSSDDTKETNSRTDSSVTEAQTPAYDDPTAVLAAAWSAYPEGDKFPIFGGSTDIATEYDGKPGPFTLTLTDELRGSLKVPESIIPQIKSAASMIHMMNANTFTCAAFEIDGDIDAFSSALVDSVNSTQWLCGFPETVITVKTGSYLIMAFGNGAVMQKFKTAVMSSVEGAALVHEGPVSFGGSNDGGIMIPVS